MAIHVNYLQNKSNPDIIYVSFQHDFHIYAFYMEFIVMESMTMELTGMELMVKELMAGINFVATSGTISWNFNRV